MVPAEAKAPVPAAAASPPATSPVPAPSAAAAPAAPAPEDTPAEPGSTVQKLKDEATALTPLVQAAWVHDFLRATDALPSIVPRTLFYDAGRTHYYTAEDADALSEAERAALKSRILDEDFYYNTRYGTPLAYARPLDLLAREGFRPEKGTILDFGFGGIGQLKLLAALGAHVTGVEVDPLTRALYSWPGDQGPVAGSAGRSGSVRLVYGHYPSEEPVKRAVGGSYTLIISKNTLKRGYIHPEQPVPDRQRIDLGVDDGAFVRTLFDALEPGGMVMIYNLCPAPSPPGKPYIPWSDGHSPFSRAVWESAGFHVLIIDQDDSAAARLMAHALGWDSGEGGMDLEHDLFALYTLVRKPERVKSS